MHNKLTISKRILSTTIIVLAITVFYDNFLVIGRGANHLISNQLPVSANSAQGHDHALTDSQPEKSWLDKAIDPETSLPFLLAVIGAAVWLYKYINAQQQELGRLRFLEVISGRLDALYDVSIKPMLSRIEERLENISTEFSDYKFKHQMLKDDIDQVRIEFEEVKRYINSSHAKLERKLAQTLGHTLESLPCQDRVRVIEDDLFHVTDFHVTDCPISTGSRNITYRQPEHNPDELD